MIANGSSVLDACETGFQKDITAIEKANILIAVLDGRTVDEGVAFELGYARALGKYCIGLKTDDRSLLRSGDNPMIIAGCNQLCSDTRELVFAVKHQVMQWPGNATDPRR